MEEELSYTLFESHNALGGKRSRELSPRDSRWPHLARATGLENGEGAEETMCLQPWSLLVASTHNSCAIPGLSGGVPEGFWGPDVAVKR